MQLFHQVSIEMTLYQKLTLVSVKYVDTSIDLHRLDQ